MGRWVRVWAMGQWFRKALLRRQAATIQRLGRRQRLLRACPKELGSADAGRSKRCLLRLAIARSLRRRADTSRHFRRETLTTLKSFPCFASVSPLSVSTCASARGGNDWRGASGERTSTSSHQTCGGSSGDVFEHSRVAGANSRHARYPWNKMVVCFGVEAPDTIDIVKANIQGKKNS